jgi:hypothetical protein
MDLCFSHVILKRVHLRRLSSIGDIVAEVYEPSSNVVWDVTLMINFPVKC